MPRAYGKPEIILSPTSAPGCYQKPHFPCNRQRRNRLFISESQDAVPQPEPNHKPMKNRYILPAIAIATCFGAVTASAKPDMRRHGGLGAPLKAYDADKDGTVSADEFATAATAEVDKLLAGFLAKHDSDADGTVTTAEAQALFATFSADWVEDVLDCFDRDGDGAITSADFIKPPRHLKPLIADFDTDADGALSAEELQAAADQMTADRLERFLTKFDTDTDGNVTTEEARAVFQTAVDKKIAAILERFDANDDGAVTFEEVIATKGKKKGKGH